MKKNIHPIKNKTLIILNNGSSYIKKWNFFKKHLKLDADFMTNNLWNNNLKKSNLNILKKYNNKN